MYCTGALEHGWSLIQRQRERSFHSQAVSRQSTPKTVDAKEHLLLTTISPASVVFARYYAPRKARSSLSARTGTGSSTCQQCQPTQARALEFIKGALFGAHQCQPRLPHRAPETGASLYAVMKRHLIRTAPSLRVAHKMTRHMVLIANALPVTSIPQPGFK